MIDLAGASSRAIFGLGRRLVVPALNLIQNGTVYTFGHCPTATATAGPRSTIPPAFPCKLSMKNIPITVFTGFLGAGKTSIILSLLPRLPEDYKVVLLKNEFGDVEGRLFKPPLNLKLTKTLLSR